MKSQVRHKLQVLNCLIFFSYYIADISKNGTTHLSYYFYLLCIVTFVSANVNYCHELVEGILERKYSKMLSWIVINGEVIVAIFFVKTTSSIDLISHIFLCLSWTSVLVLYFEIKAKSEEIEDTSDLIDPENDCRDTQAEKTLKNVLKKQNY